MPTWRTPAPILFIGNVGEEGEGESARDAAHLPAAEVVGGRSAHWSSLDGAGTDTIIAEGLGSRRYEVTVRGPGGHSWSDFGVANPIVALARIIDRFSRTPVPGFAEDDVQRRDRQRRDFGEFDSGVGDHAG